MSDINLLRDCPPSISSDEQIQALAQALTAQMVAVDEVIQKIVLWDDFSGLSDGILKHLAWWLHVDTWDDSAVRSRREATIRNALEWHRHKGTMGMVESVLSAIYQDSALQEAWEYGGEAYHFRVLLFANQMDIGSRSKLLTQIQDIKNTRSWLDGLYYLQEPGCSPIYLSGWCFAEGGNTVIEANMDADIQVQPNTVYTAGVVIDTASVTL